MITEKIISKTNSFIGQHLPQSNISTASIEEIYLEIMKKLQFGKRFKIKIVTLDKCIKRKSGIRITSVNE